MSDTPDDPWLGLLTDIAEGVAALTARVDAMETEAAAHRAQVNEALGTIAEITTRTYYASKPSSPLPDDIINTGVMDAMIERWPMQWIMPFPSAQFKMLKDLESMRAAEIEAMLRTPPELAEDATNAERLRHARILMMLNEEMDKRFKAHQKSMERDEPERSR